MEKKTKIILWSIVASAVIVGSVATGLVIHNNEVQAQKIAIQIKVEKQHKQDLKNDKSQIDVLQKAFKINDLNSIKHLEDFKSITKEGKVYQNSFIVKDKNDIVASYKTTLASLIIADTNPIWSDQTQLQTNITNLSNFKATVNNSIKIALTQEQVNTNVKSINDEIAKEQAQIGVLVAKAAADAKAASDAKVTATKQSSSQSYVSSSSGNTGTSYYSGGSSQSGSGSSSGSSSNNSGSHTGNGSGGTILTPPAPAPGTAEQDPGWYYSGSSWYYWDGTTLHVNGTGGYIHS